MSRNTLLKITALLIILIGLLSVSYKATLLISLGVIVYLLLERFFQSRSAQTPLSKMILTRLSVGLISLIVLSFILFAVLLVPDGLRLLRYDLGVNIRSRIPLMSEFLLSARSVDSSLQSFAIQESGTINPQLLAIMDPRQLEQLGIKNLDTIRAVTIGDESTITFPERTIEAVQSGFFTREVTIYPAWKNSSGYMQYTTATGATVDTFDFNTGLCCRSISVEVYDFPIGAFSTAYDARGFEQHPNVDLETLTWTVPYSDRPITFSYFTPPFHYFSRLLRPVSSLTSFIASINDVLLVLLGAALWAVGRWIRGRVKARFNKPSQYRV